jgi:hypothetical protein
MLAAGLCRHGSIVAAVASGSLIEDVERIGAAAAVFVRDGERLAAVLPAEPASGRRVFVCAYESNDPGAAARSWLVLDDGGATVADRTVVRDAVTVAALCELAAEHAALGDLDELRSQLVAVRLTEAPPGVEEAEEAAAELQRTIGVPPQLASPARLDAIGAAVRRLELALDPGAPSPFAGAMQAAQGAVDELVHEVESSYRTELHP